MRSLWLILAALVGAHAQGDQPCSKQMELEHRCTMNIEVSPEATVIRERKKQVMKTCAPDLPQDCHAQWEAAHDCAISIGKNADTDPLFVESKSKSQPAIDQCFEKYPPNVKQGFQEIFMMMKPQHPPPRYRHWGKKGNETSSSGEVSEEDISGESNDTSSSYEKHHRGGGGRGGGGKHHGGGGRGGGGRGGHGKHCHHGGHGGRGGRGGHGGRGGRGHHGRHGPKNWTASSSESNSNEMNNSSSSSSSSESGGKSGGRSGGKSGSWERKRMPEQCRKTEEQMKCIHDEFKKLAKDNSFIGIMNTLIRQKKKCKQLVDWSCSSKCPKRQKCIFKATKPCREAFMQRMKTCIEEKGFTLPPFMQGNDAFTTPMPVLEN